MLAKGGIIIGRVGQPSGEWREAMGFLDRLLHRKGEAASAAGIAEVECPHVALVPYWDSAEDIGNAEKVVRYECESCKASFGPEEGERIRAEGTERMRISEDERRERLSQ